MSKQHWTGTYGVVDWKSRDRLGFHVLRRTSSTPAAGWTLATWRDAGTVGLQAECRSSASSVAEVRTCICFGRRLLHQARHEALLQTASFYVRFSWDPTSASEAAAAAGRDHQLERPFVEKGALPLSGRKNGCAEECNKGSVGTSIMTALVSVWIHPHV